MKITKLSKTLALGGVLLVVTMTVWAQQKAPSIDPKADAALKQMSAALAGAKSFTFEAHAITDQILDSGQKVQFARNQKIAVRRPDKVHASVVGDNENFEFIYDGKRVVLMNTQQNRYAVADAKASIDDTLDMLAGEYGIALPLADLLFANPYQVLTERVRSGEDLGVGYVFSVKCRHLAFRQETVDWQIWIDEASKLPRKIVITYKEQPAHPQYTAFLNSWNLSADVRDAEFKFTPPATATKTDFAAPAAATQPASDEK